MVSTGADGHEPDMWNRESDPVDRVVGACRVAYRRLRRVGRRELRDARRWLEGTDNLIHLTVLFAVPILIGVVTWLSNAVATLSFLLFPPLAAGTYTLFSDPEGRYASPRRFVGGLTLGALCGWLALELLAYVFSAPTGRSGLTAGGAALGVLFTAVGTWALDLEEPAAFSTALLVLVTGTSQFAYVVSVAVSSTLVAGAFVLWRDRFYERRARYLYHSTQGDDHVLVPVRGDRSERIALFAARIAAAHEAGKVVLFDAVSPQELEKAEAAARSTGTSEVRNGDGEPAAVAEERVVEHATARLRLIEEAIDSTVDVPCETIVATTGSDPGKTVLRVAREANCDLVVVPFETEDGAVSRFTRTVLQGEIDAIAFRPVGDRTDWKRVLIPVAKPGASAHAMLDFAGRLVGEAATSPTAPALTGATGRVSVCTCIDDESERRAAERRLADLAETVSAPLETRVSRADITKFIETAAPRHDLTILGANLDRSTPSRLIRPSLFERILDVECDLAVVHAA